MKKRLLIILLLSLLFTNGCNLFKKNEELSDRAIEYFTSKYNINKEDIVIEKNSLYKDDEETVCINSCDNDLIINYNNKRYIIEYDINRDLFTDNYQYEEVHKEFVNYLKDKFDSHIDYLSVSLLDSSVFNKSLKYTNDIKTYITNINKLDELETHHVRTNVDIKINVENEIKAKELYNKYALDIINELESLKVNFSIEFTKDINDIKSPIYYYVKANDNQISLTDKVSDNNIYCKRGSFDGSKCN